MRVGFNARLLAAPDLRGWNRYTRNLLAALPAVGVTPVLYTDRPIHPDHLAALPAGTFEVRVGDVRPYARWEQIWLPRQCGNDHVDILHAPANFGLPWSSPCPRVLTLHDAIDAAYHAPRQSARERWGLRGLRSRFGHWASRVRADRVITVSEHARGDLVHKLGLPASRVRVTPEAADPLFLSPVSGADRSRARSRFSLNHSYIFYIGGWEARKNLPFLVRAFDESGIGRDGIQLVLAGGRDDQRSRLTSLGLGDRLRLLGRVDDADLPTLYAEALAFAYPSEYEGFGLQLVEAMAVGCPVLAARATCLPEVLGEGGLTFDIGLTDELAGFLRRVAHDPVFRDDLVRRARARSGDFTWSRTAEATLAVYRELVQSL